MKATNSRSILLHLSSPSSRISCAHILFFHLRDGAGFQRRRAESFTTSTSPSPPQWRHHHDEESKGVKVAVWWDFENCSVPNGVNVFRVPHRITSALRSHGIRGPVSITAFGDVCQISRSTQDALYTAGVCLNHVPNCGKNSSDRSLLADLVYWVAQNPPPVHFFLISGDRDFANILHRLRMNNYNILLACTDGASGALCNAATVMWQWNMLVRGENLTGRYFNHPPDGLYGSWYGHHRGSLENPFPDPEEATSLQLDECMESIADAKPRQIPKALMNRIRQILHSYPEGISLTDLRAELKKNNVALDKDYFGHKKFSHLLLSMPSILRLRFNTGIDTQPLVYGVHQRMMDPLDQSSKTAAGVGSNTGDREQSRAAENDGNGKPSLLPQPATENPYYKVDMATASKCDNVHTVHIGTTAKEESTLHKEAKIATIHKHDSVGNICKEVDAQPVDTQSTPMQKEEALNTQGFLGRTWKILIGRKSGSTDGGNSISQMGSIPRKTAHTGAPTNVENCPNPERMGSKEETVKLKTSSSIVSSSNLLSSEHAFSSPPDVVESKVKPFQGPPVSTKTSSKSAPRETNAGLFVKNNDACGNSSFFSWIFARCRFWKTNCEDDATVSQENQSGASDYPRESVDGQGSDLCAASDSNLSNLGSKPEPHDLFSKSHFWDSVESFLHSSKALDLVSKSRIREELVYGLQKEGPLVLSALKESHLHQLVNLLITDKKWIKECASQANPFKLTFPAKRLCIPSHANGVNGLRSIFSNQTSQSKSGLLSKQDIGNQNHQPHGNSSSGSVDTKLAKDILELKAWFRKACNTGGCISSKEFEKHFEKAFDRRLDCSFYGYFTMDDLFAACTADADDDMKGKETSREVTLSHCRNLLVDFMKHNPQGFNVGLFRPMFFKRYGYVLDYQMLGYPKLVTLLQIMPGVKIESSTVLPAAMFQPDSKMVKGVGDEVYTYSVENNKATDSSINNEDPINDDDCVWEELGPVSGIEKSKPAMEEKIGSNETVVVDEEFSDAEECPSVPCQTNKQAYNRNNASSAFLEVLDNYYGRQGMGGVEKDQAQESRYGDEDDKMQATKEGIDIYQAQAVDGLVDCSRKKDTKTMESKPLDLVMQKGKSHKSYSFVSE